MKCVVNRKRKYSTMKIQVLFFYSCTLKLDVFFLRTTFSILHAYLMWPVCIIITAYENKAGSCSPYLLTFIAPLFFGRGEKQNKRNTERETMSFKNLCQSHPHRTPHMSTFLLTNNRRRSLFLFLADSQLPCLRSWQ